MFRAQKILVGVDLDLLSGYAPSIDLPRPTREAVDLAIRIASYHGGSIVFQTVLEQPELLDSRVSDLQPGGESSLQPQIEQVLNSLRKEAEDLGVSAQVRLTSGRAWMELVCDVLREQHDLVVVGSRDFRGLERFWIGSVGVKLLRKCPCPVWIVRPDPDPDTNAVLVADDLGEVGVQCLHAGVAAAKVLDARLIVVHALTYPLEFRLIRSGTPPEEISAYRTRTREDAERIVHERLSLTDYRTLERGTRVELIDGPVEVVVPSVIEDHNVDLVVMGTLGRSGVPGLLLGNSAERLYPEVSCSLLAIKPEGFQTPVTLT